MRDETVAPRNPPNGRRSALRPTTPQSAAGWPNGAARVRSERHRASLAPPPPPRRFRRAGCRPESHRAAHGLRTGPNAGVPFDEPIANCVASIWRRYGAGLFDRATHGRVDGRHVSARACATRQWVPDAAGAQVVFHRDGHPGQRAVASDRDCGDLLCARHGAIATTRWLNALSCGLSGLDGRQRVPAHLAAERVPERTRRGPHEWSCASPQSECGNPRYADHPMTAAL